MPFPADLFSTTKGFLKESEGRCLYEIAREAARLGPCLEIGGYCGRSTLCIGAACKERGAVLFSVDHHRGSEEQQPGEQSPIAIIFCGGKDTELVELMDLEPDNIHVGEYWLKLPPKEVLQDKLHKAMVEAR